MIVARINSGLGNQLFQYAMARHLALLNETELQFDIRYYEKDTRRTFALDQFNISAKIFDSSKFAILKQRRPRWRHALYALASRVRWPGRALLRMIKERHFHFDPEILKERGNLYLDGYWQSEKYFAASRDLLREELRLKEAPFAANRDLLEQISNSLSLGIHVRRGDFVSNPQTHAVHGICSMEYYKRAARLVVDRVGEPKIFVFSDDPEWVRAQFDIGMPFHAPEHNQGGKDCEDLRLMSHCRHHIIANSTFGWWGAWLGAKSGQIVVAPASWTKTPVHNTQDVVPADWIKIEPW